MKMTLAQFESKYRAVLLGSHRKPVLGGTKQLCTIDVLINGVETAFSSTKSFNDAMSFAIAALENQHEQAN